MSASLTNKILTLEDSSDVEQELTFEQIAKVNIDDPGEGAASFSSTGSDIRRVGEIFFVGFGIGWDNSTHVTYTYPASGTYAGAQIVSAYNRYCQGMSFANRAGGSAMQSWDSNSERCYFIANVRTS